MFKRKYWFLRGGPVVSDEGFSVSFRGRTTIHYEDGKENVIVSGEQMARVSDWVVYANRMSIGSYPGPKLSDESRRQLIVERITAAGRFLGMSVEVDYS